ncbi:hypothetical protein HELRODRAFT_156650 [Helobdella robusta]|uniref:Carbonic anhydrase n=1 Tax=Helobdella robusta TaxID=6412 RepID=T1ELZ3_HELRO|nr:hypothetical protein HELRODRAFT_156650 [Helobdella robusta]ESO08091.1 hypothetical protein HELRODRAFT_156650 [Helobdella robusta]
MPGLNKLLRGILKYRTNLQPHVLKQFQRVKDNPQPSSVMFSCMDSRLIITKMINQDVGDMFLVRNAGNLIPNNDSLSFDSVTTEPAALELGCVINKIRHVLVCGHSDCKAMNALYEMMDSVQKHEGTPLQIWLKRHGARTIVKYKELLQVGGVGPIKFQAETPEKVFDAYIDVDNKFKPVDKLSQVNTLQQLQNIASYPFLRDKLESGLVRMHALWIDIYTGDFYMFCRDYNRFVLVDEESYQNLLDDGESVTDY